jgi:hypothetical protein
MIQYPKYFVHSKLGRSATTDQSQVIGGAHHLNKPDAGIEICRTVRTIQKSSIEYKYLVWL